MIEARQVADALRPRFGSGLANDPGLAEPAAALMRDYAPHRSSFKDLASQVEEALFNAVYERLGPGMSARMDDGTTRRIRMAEMPDAADDAMGVLFDSLKVYSVSCQALWEYSMETGSLAAMRCLYQKYEAFLPPEDRQVLARVIRGSFPPERWKSWLPARDPESSGG